MGYFYGATSFEKEEESNCKYIKEKVDEYEKNNFGIGKIVKEIFNYLNLGFENSLELTYGDIDESEGYYLSKINEWGTSTPLTQILATHSMVRDEAALISILDEFDIAYNL